MNLNGKIIVIEGTDGSGKQTQTALLKKRLEEAGYNVFSTSFPNYPSDSSAAVRMYLNGEIRPNASEVSAKAASIFYAVDRYITYKKEIEQVYKEGKHIILFDRYVSSNIIHQGAKLLSSLDAKCSEEYELKTFISWLEFLEHSDFEIPKADVTIYLNVPVDYTIKLREKRANKITGGEKQDIHEADTEYLRLASKAGRMAAKMLNWEVIECVQEDNMRTIEDISNQIWDEIQKLV